MTSPMNLIRLIPAMRGTPARKNSAGSLVIQGSQRLSRIATIVAAAAALDPVRFAALAVALALTDIVRAALLAYDVSAVRLISGGGDSGAVMGTHLGAKVVVGLLGTLVIVSFSAVVYGPDTTWLVVVSSLGVLPAGVASLLMARRQVDFRLGSAASAVLAGSLIGAAMAVAGLLVTHEAMAVAGGLAIGDVLILIALAPGLRAARRANAREIRDVIQRAWTLLVMQLAYIGQFRVGTVILGAAGTAVAVGEYTVASRLAEGLVIMAAAVTASSLPLMGGAFARDDKTTLRRLMSKSYGLSLLAAAPPVALLALGAPVWIAILFPRYPGAAAVFIPVGLTVVVFFASSQTTAFLNASHRDRTAAMSASVGLAFSIVGSWWLVMLGAIGVAVARLGAELVRLAIETAAIARVAGYLTRSMGAAWIAIAPILIVVLVPAALGWSIPIVVVGGAVVVVFSVLAIARFRVPVGT
jgi:O-antigen/teichoic acid export membrane protein